MNRLIENIDEDYFKKELENIKQDDSIIIEETYYHCIDCISEFMKQFTTLNNNLNLLNIPQNNGSILPEYILHAYLQATIENDISTFNDSDDSITILNNDNLRTFVETFKIGGRDNFSKKIKLFRTSYKNYIYGNSKQPSLFQNRFYDFLTTYNIISIKNPSESLNYAVPLHFAPIFISIINAWTYSPVAYSTQSMNTVNKQLSFHSFRDSFNKTLNYFNPDEAYQLFAEYFICFFFSNKYIDQFITESQYFFEYSVDDASKLINERNKYERILSHINHYIPYLYFKQLYACEATKIYETNKLNIIKPETKYTVDADIIEHISNLCTDIKNIIEKTRDRELKFIKTNLSIIDDIENNTTFYIRQELFSEYIINLQNTNSICLMNIILSQQNFLQYLYNYRSKLDFIPYKLNIIETERTLTIFLVKTLKILKEGISTHKEQLNKKYPTSEKPLSYKDEKLSSIIYLYEETFLKLLNLVPSLEKEMNNTPPFQNPVSPKKENSYESLINTMNNTPVYFTYEYLFNSFYNRLTYLNSNNKTTPLWHILHIYISTHIKKMKRILKLPQ